MTPDEHRNPYAAPRSSLDTPHEGDYPSSVQAAMAGQYDFTIRGVMEESWELIDGIKGAFWGALAIASIVYGVLDELANRALERVLERQPHALTSYGVSVVVGVLVAPLFVGPQVVCLRRAMGKAVSWRMAFGQLNRSGTLIVQDLLVTVFTYLGLVLLVAPGVYLLVGYMLAPLAVVDAQLPAWRSMEASRRAVTHKWFRVLGLTVVVGVLTALSALALLIPLIWTLPWAAMTVAVLYRRIFHPEMPAPFAQMAQGAAPGVGGAPTG